MTKAIESPYMPANLQTKIAIGRSPDEDTLTATNALTVVFFSIAVTMVCVVVPGIMSFVAAFMFMAGWIGTNMARDAIASRPFRRAEDEVAARWTVNVDDVTYPLVLRISDSIVGTPEDRRADLRALWEDTLISVEVLRHRPEDQDELARLDRIAREAEAYRDAAMMYAVEAAEARRAELEASAAREADMVIEGLRASRDANVLEQIRVTAESIRYV